MHPCVMLFLNDYFRKLVIGHKRPTFLWQWSSCLMSEQIGRQDHQEICLHLEVGDWTPECCCKQSPEKNHWGILKHCSMSHLVACPKHSASKINRSTDFSGSKVQKQRARWNWHHVAHSSDGGWIYIWSMFFLIFLEYLFYWWKIYQRWGVVGKAVGNAGQMEGHENSKDRPSKSWQLTFRRTLERLGLHPTSKRWPKNQQNHTLLLMLQPLDISTLGWSLKRKLARVVLDDSI